MKQQETCPYCGARDNVIGLQDGYAALRKPKLMAMRKQGLYHVICAKCGTVIRSYVENPEKLRIKNED